MKYLVEFLLDWARIYRVNVRGYQQHLYEIFLQETKYQKSYLVFHNWLKHAILQKYCSA